VALLYNVLVLQGLFPRITYIGESGDGHQQRVNSVLFLSTGTLCSVGEDRLIIQWDIVSGQIIRYIITVCCVTSASKKKGSKHGVRTIAINGNVMAVASTTLKLLDVVWERDRKII